MKKHFGLKIFAALVVVLLAIGVCVDYPMLHAIIQGNPETEEEAVARSALPISETAWANPADWDIKKNDDGTVKQIYNPYLPLNEYIPDGEPHVFGDRVYVYGSHDKAGSDRFCVQDYTVCSAVTSFILSIKYIRIRSLSVLPFCNSLYLSSVIPLKIVPLCASTHFLPLLSVLTNGWQFTVSSVPTVASLMCPIRLFCGGKFWMIFLTILLFDAHTGSVMIFSFLL